MINVSYMAVSGRMVTLEDLEAACAEMGHLIHGSILALRDLPANEELGQEQCARLTLAMAALKYLENYLENIFPA